jgi:hypothetical protein
MRHVTYLPGHRRQRRAEAILNDAILNDPIDDLFTDVPDQVSRAVSAAGQREHSNTCGVSSGNPKEPPKVPLAPEVSDV